MVPAAPKTRGRLTRRCSALASLAAELQRSADEMSTTMAPEARTTPRASERENANLVDADAVHNLIGETRDEHSTRIERCEARTGLRSLGDSVDSSENR